MMKLLRQCCIFSRDMLATSDVAVTYSERNAFNHHMMIAFVHKLVIILVSRVLHEALFTHFNTSGQTLPAETQMKLFIFRSDRGDWFCHYLGYIWIWQTCQSGSLWRWRFQTWCSRAFGMYAFRVSFWRSWWVIGCWWWIGIGLDGSASFIRNCRFLAMILEFKSSLCRWAHDDLDCNALPGSSVILHAVLC